MPLTPEEEARIQAIERFNPTAAAQLRTQANAIYSGQGAQNQIGAQAGLASDFAATGQQGYGALSGETAGLRKQLGRYASGQDSISAEQLRQGLQQNISGQQAMAAGARPANAAMAARGAAMNAGRAASGLSGQQAMAGIAERQAATQSLGGMLLQERGQDLQAALQSRGQAVGAYGIVNDQANKTMADAQAHNAQVEKNQWDRIKALGAVVKSDRRLKKDIADGDLDADEFIKGLKAYRFKYKSDKHGTGDHLGIMAQDLERTKLGRQAVLDLPDGKAVHGARLATSLAAATARLGARLAKLEGKG